MGKHVVVGLFVLNVGEKGGEVVRQVCLPLAGLAVDVDDFLPDVDIRDLRFRISPMRMPVRREVSAIRQTSGETRESPSRRRSASLR